MVVVVMLGRAENYVYVDIHIKHYIMQISSSADQAAQFRAILEEATLRLWDPHFCQRVEHADAYTNLRAKLLSAIFSDDGSLKDQHRLETDDSTQQIKEKLRNVDAIIREFQDSVHALVTAQKADFEAARRHVDTVNADTQDNSRLRIEVGNNPFNLSSKAVASSMLLSTMVVLPELSENDEDSLSPPWIDRDHETFPRLVWPYPETDLAPPLLREHRFFMTPLPSPMAAFLYLALHGIKRWSMEFFPDEYTSHQWTVSYKSRERCGQYNPPMYMQRMGTFDLRHRVLDVLIREEWALRFPDDVMVHEYRQHGWDHRWAEFLPNTYLCLSRVGSYIHDPAPDSLVTTLRGQRVDAYVCQQDMWANLWHTRAKISFAPLPNFNSNFLTTISSLLMHDPI